MVQPVTLSHNPAGRYFCLGKPGFWLNFSKGQTDYPSDQLMVAEHIWQVDPWWDQRLKAAAKLNFKTSLPAGTSLCPEQPGQHHWLQAHSSHEWMELFNYYSRASSLMTKTKHSLQSSQWWSPSFQEETSTFWKDGSPGVVPAFCHVNSMQLLLIGRWLSWKTWKICVFTTASPRIWSRFFLLFKSVQLTTENVTLKNISTFISLQRETVTFHWESEKDKPIYPSVLAINHFPFFFHRRWRIVSTSKIPFLYLTSK